MKKYLKQYLLIPFFLVFLMSSYVFASPSIDGRMDSGEWSSDGSYIEEQGSSSGSSYDVEKLGLFVNNNTLYFGLQTDFNIKTNDYYYPNSGDFNYINSGDFIFDIGDNGTYDFALSFSISNTGIITFTEYSGTITWDKTTDFKNFAVGNNNTLGVSEALAHPLSHLTPSEWKSSSDGAPWQAQTASSINNIDSKYVHSKYNYNNDYDYANYTGYTIEAAIDLNGLSNNLANLLAENSSVNMLWQMECGNDYLEVTENYTKAPPVSPVPEPATFLLFGIGLLSLSSVGRYKLNK